VLLLLSVFELDIDNFFTYVFYALGFDFKTLAIWYSPLFIVLGLGLFIRHKWWSKVSNALFLLLYLAALVIGLISVFYYPVSKTIVGVEIFQLVKGQNFTVILSYLREYWWVILITLAVLVPVYILYSKLNLELSRKSAFLFGFVSLVVLAILARGSFKLKPLNTLDAYSALQTKEAISAVTPVYVLLESIGKTAIDYAEYVSEAEIISEIAKDELHYANGLSAKPNICLILLESFGKEYTSLNDSYMPSYTPFLDSLMSVSMNFANAYSNGLRSMDAVAAIYTGVPCLMKQPFIGSLYTQSDIESIPEALSHKGYFCSFYHAADELSMGFKPFLMANGLDLYVAKQQYPKNQDFDGTWGIFDEPFLQFFKKQLSSQKQPWCSGVFTISSHHPYTVPTEYKHLPKGTIDIHQSIAYTDNALRAFFKAAKNEKWFDNTIFIITADHTSVNETAEHQGYRSKFGVPLLIYSPLVPPGISHKAVQHIDIFPTVKQLAGVNKQIAIGRSLLDTSEHKVLLYDGVVYTYTNDSLTLRWEGAETYKLFAYQEDKVEIHDLATTRNKDGDRMFRELKVLLQKYNYRLLNNKFN
jgi:phosphoglycerol transferase MdoB-like AlkP superfamily enzyme